MPERHQLGDLQLAIMRVLWTRDEATVNDVHSDLAGRELAPTTIATMLKKMEVKGIVDHRTEGRQFVYSATITESEVHRSMVSDLTERLFNGDAAALVSHLLTEGEIDPTELSEIQKRIRRAGRKK